MKIGSRSQLVVPPADPPGRKISTNACLLVFLLWGLAFALACRLLNMPEQQTVERGLAGKLLGITRGEIGGDFYERADCAFHKGVGHFQPMVSSNWFARMRREVAPAGHAHLHAEGVLEIMPWLYFATRADPRNVTAYVVAAYWLAGEAGRPDLAEQVLNEARRNNPSDYRVYMEKGNLALKEGRFRKAERFFDTAFSLWQGTTQHDEEQMRIDLAEILTYRGLLYEISGNPQNASRCYHEVTRLFPGRLQLKERMLTLDKNGRGAPAPEELVKILLRLRRHVCAEAEDDG